MSESSPHREACRKEHRLIGHYIAIKAWIRDLDCVVLTRNDLSVLLNLERFRSERIKWLMDDLRPWFPYQEAHYLSNSPSSVHSIYLSRKDISEWLPKGSMTTSERIEAMSPFSPKTELFVLPETRVPFKEEIVSFLAFLNAGLIDPRDYGGISTTYNNLMDKLENER